MDFYIRPICLEDAKGINELRRMPGVFENIFGMPSERVKRNEDFIATMGENVHQFVAVMKNSSGGETVIGTAGITVSTVHRMRHCASLGIMVHRDYQHMGVGTKLMEAIIDTADNWLMLVRIELGVYYDNEKAVNLYKKFGFEIEGYAKKSVIRNGEYIDAILMARVRDV